MTEAECKAIDSAALKRYYKIREPAWEDYKLKKISQKEYDIIQGKAWEEYEAAQERMEIERDEEATR